MVLPSWRTAETRTRFAKEWRATFDRPSWTTRYTTSYPSSSRASSAPDSAGERRVDARPPAELGDERPQRGREAEVIERRRARLAREAQQLLHRLRRDALRLTQLVA
jgi:hypothetical protein